MYPVAFLEMLVRCQSHPLAWSSSPSPTWWSYLPRQRTTCIIEYIRKRNWIEPHNWNQTRYSIRFGLIRVEIVSIPNSNNVGSSCDHVETMGSELKSSASSGRLFLLRRKLTRFFHLMTKLITESTLKTRQPSLSLSLPLPSCQLWGTPRLGWQFTEVIRNWGREAQKIIGRLWHSRNSVWLRLRSLSAYSLLPQTDPPLGTSALPITASGTSRARRQLGKLRRRRWCHSSEHLRLRRRRRVRRCRGPRIRPTPRGCTPPAGGIGWGRSCWLRAWSAVSPALHSWSAPLCSSSSSSGKKTGQLPSQRPVGSRPWRHRRELVWITIVTLTEFSDNGLIF